MNRATGVGAMNRACDQWIRNATQGERQLYVRTGAYGDSGLTDMRSQAQRRADVLRVIGRQRSARPTP
ncbi:hypothetical protein ACIQV3_22490 [Streptomyces sp. NPDC099050]|uniref:hypothetical protein n=1 Tax=Streptomyces sp. NPDC099050 TaxID=3366100 RepID=UPI0037FD437B